MPYHNTGELEVLLNAFAADANGGVLMVPPPPTENNRELINRLALEHRLPTISAYKTITAEGGLMSYGPDNRASYEIAAGYIDRILRGSKVSELPVQFPSKYELVINLKTAKAIGLDIPAQLLARADGVIE